MQNGHCYIPVNISYVIEMRYNDTIANPNETINEAAL